MIVKGFKKCLMPNEMDGRTRKKLGILTVNMRV
jgi:hypothetical protein